MTQSGGAENTFSSVTLYNFPKKWGGGLKPPPSPSPSAGPVKVGRFCDEEMSYLYNFCRLGLENPARYPLPTTNITFIDIKIVGFLA